MVVVIIVPYELDSYDKSTLKILMVSTEFPPIPGGVGRYTKNLTDGLKRLGVQVSVLCNEKGGGEYIGIDPKNENNSKIIFEVIAEYDPDLVHIQLEHGLYGLKMDYINPNKLSTNIDEFYEECKIPIVTTFHSAYPLRQWMELSKHTHLLNKDIITFPINLANQISDYWKRFINYRSFNSANKQKMQMSQANIAFSNYLTKLISENENVSNDEKSLNNFSVIYHGAEPNLNKHVKKREARAAFSLPLNHKIALFFGFMTHTKGWDILNDLDIPNDWVVVINQSENLFNLAKPVPIKDQNIQKINYHTEIKNLQKGKIVNLNRGFLTDKDLSMLFYACDIIVLPYTVTSGSGVMFDALAHGLPFIATDLGFFKEFANKGLGIVAKRKPNEFAKAIKKLESEYLQYTQRIEMFNSELTWDNVALQHFDLYSNVLGKNNKIKNIPFPHAGQ
ncbi:glycosyltransferase family 4 protein [Candidatus Nitrosocosmicus hydrocola]|uniref:glycosyltransferase family 4 protein n=1 Tax=Candidatus Nitrosocosmicus hydrocola TaxID=1826872 RepID=UPI0011E5AC53|nr:glycosyltransferase family 4 protein [Candidatus Nitrosocosmicus hydrocola]